MRNWKSTVDIKTAMYREDLPTMERARQVTDILNREKFPTNIIEGMRKSIKASRINRWDNWLNKAYDWADQNDIWMGPK